MPQKSTKKTHLQMNFFKQTKKKKKQQMEVYEKKHQTLPEKNTITR